VSVDRLDRDGTNVTASLLLDAHHDVAGVSDFGDDIYDNCAVCGFAVGWFDLPLADNPRAGGPGHATAASSFEVEGWIGPVT
jgi:hypothetical protein